jgi:hypothetical protein
MEIWMDGMDGGGVFTTSDSFGTAWPGAAFCRVAQYLTLMKWHHSDT